MFEILPTPQAAQQCLSRVKPYEYAHSRLMLNGALTYLSAYLTHGFLSVPDVAAEMYRQHRLGVQHKLMYQLGWREYFQHLHHHLGDAIGQPLREGLLPDAEYGHTIPDDVRHACTRVPVIDQAVRTLYATGYLHNHARLWLASYLVHLRKVHWRVAADWLYGYLLDGDLASNYLNWQWVAATGSAKPYLFNANSIVAYAPASWHSPSTVLDTSLETLEILATNPARVAQAREGEEPCEVPACLQAPPSVFAFYPPRASDVAGKHVWLVHPWMLADLPQDLPDDVICVAVVFREYANAHPWSEGRWQFVGTRMAALTPHRWVGACADVLSALAHAQSVSTVGHVCLPDVSGAAIHIRPAPRLYPQLASSIDSFSKWWVLVNKNVRYLHQLLPSRPTRSA